MIYRESQLRLAGFLCLFLSMNLILTGQSQQPIPVKVEKSETGYTLLRGGEPYYVEGVGGQVHLEKAKAYGANSLRTWSADNAQEVLDEAHELGMTVLLGLWVGHERHGFDYDDGKAVEGQLLKFKSIVEKYKDHPALLMWGIGNEADLFYRNFKVWNHINDIAKMIHETDPNHPTMTVTAGLDVAEVQLIQERAPHIDILGVNTYGELLRIPKSIRAYGWTKPYMITEWGPNGHWEVEKTSWKVPMEQTSSQKAVSYGMRYRKGILSDKEQCMGSYVFLWGQKQETTPTWYGLFLESGEETEVMDTLQYFWSDKLPENLAPHIESITIDGKEMNESVRLKKRQKCKAEFVVTDPDNDKIIFKWELLPESTDIKAGGDAESRPEPVEIQVKSESESHFEFVTPGKSGAYRLFLYAFDGKGKVATANFPLWIQ